MAKMNLSKGIGKVLYGYSKGLVRYRSVSYDTERYANFIVEYGTISYDRVE